MKFLNERIPKKISNYFKLEIIKFIKHFNHNRYTQLYRRFLKNNGMHIKECGLVANGGWIDSTVYFDNYDYSLISIGDMVTISRDVRILCHDWSVANGIYAVDKTSRGGYLMKPVSIGNNVFIGMGSIILPGSNIGNDVIIGAGSVVKGNIPDNSVVIGNPARIIKSTTDYGKQRMQLKDYISL